MRNHFSFSICNPNLKSCRKCNSNIWSRMSCGRTCHIVNATGSCGHSRGTHMCSHQEDTIQSIGHDHPRAAGSTAVQAACLFKLLFCLPLLSLFHRFFASVSILDESLFASDLLCWPMTKHCNAHQREAPECSFKLFFCLPLFHRFFGSA